MAATLIRKRQLENLAIVNADISAGAAIATSKLADAANFILRTGATAFTADQSMGGFKLTNLAAPISANDAARLVDVQNIQAGITAKEACRVATTANITLSATQSIDGIAVLAGDRVLVKNQTTASANGIYVCAAGAWARSADADVSAELKSGTFVFVNEGSTQADTGWLLSTDGAITLDTTSLTFVQFTGAGQITAGAGLLKTGNTFDIGTASASRIVVNADNIDLATTVTGGTNTKITYDNYGRVTSGTAATAADVGAQPSSVELTAESGLSTTGLIVRTGAGARTTRTLTGTGARITVSNGDGVAGNPTIDLATAGTAGTYNKVITDAYGRVTSATLETYIDGTHFVVRETPTGLVNSSNVTFNLANTPTTGKEQVYYNGVLQEPGAGNDYTISGATITMLTAPDAGDKLRVSYTY